MLFSRLFFIFYYSLDESHTIVFEGVYNDFHSAFAQVLFHKD